MRKRPSHRKDPESQEWIPTRRTKVENALKKGAKYGAALTLSVGTLGLIYLTGKTILGENDQPLDPYTDRQAATKKYQDFFSAQDPEARFLAQYVSIVNVVGLEAKGGSGLLDFASSRDDDRSVFRFNNACLRNTAYDTGGGYVEGSLRDFLFSGRISGRSPSAVATAHVDSKAPNVLEIHAGNDSSEVLRFNGAVSGRQLTPANGHTEDALETHGCETGIVSAEKEYQPRDEIL